MTQSGDSTGQTQRLAKNTLLNILGRSAPLLVGVVAMPVIIRGLGTDRFGLLSLIWVIFGYFAIFDFGLGRAVTKYVAELVGKEEEEEIPPLLWSAVVFQALLGIAGAGIWYGIASLLVNRVLTIPPELMGEAKAAFLLLTVAVPVVLLTKSFQGLLEADQRFGIINTVAAPSRTLLFLLPMVGVLLDVGLVGIVLMLVGLKMAELISFSLFSFFAFPVIRRVSVRFSSVKSLFSFGSWITLSSIVVPLMDYLDRFLIGSLFSMSAVSFYTAPYDVVTRIRVLPSSLNMALFPALSSQSAREESEVNRLHSLAVKYLFVFLSPIILLLMLFARQILGLWLGSEFAVNSTLVFQILAIGALFSALAGVTGTLLQGVGRPDAVAKIMVALLPFYLGLLWGLVHWIGIAGAAVAWTALQTGLVVSFSAAGWKLRRVPVGQIFGDVRTSLAMFVGINLFIFSRSNGIIGSEVSAEVFGAVGVIFIALFTVLMIYTALTTEDRRFLLQFLTPERLFLRLKGTKVHSFSLLIREVEGLRDKIRFLGYILSNNLPVVKTLFPEDVGENHQQHQDLCIIFSRGTIWFGRGAGELSSYIEIFLRGDYALIDDFVASNGDIVVDVGANIGLYTLWQAQNAQGGKILAFEPNPRAYSRLRKNVRANGLEDVETRNLALFSRECRLALSQQVPTGTSELRKFGESRVPVKASTLDLELKKSALDHIDILKIDVEGSELDVLLGAESSLPFINKIVLECHSVELENRVSDYLSRHDFHCLFRKGLSRTALVYYSRERV